MRRPASDTALVCPRCDTTGVVPERFCPSCGMPFAFASIAVEREDASRDRARKVKKQFLEGPLVRVAVARHQAEAELISGLLLEHGVPSVARRTAGFDVPDMLFAGPRDVMVPQAGEEVAREVLREVEAEHAADQAVRAEADRVAGRPPRRRATRSTRTTAWIVAIALAVVGVAPIFFWLGGL